MYLSRPTGSSSLRHWRPRSLFALESEIVIDRSTGTAQSVGLGTARTDVDLGIAGSAPELADELLERRNNRLEILLAEVSPFVEVDGLVDSPVFLALQRAGFRKSGLMISDGLFLVPRYFTWVA